jgi:hypothetical protein
MTCLLDYRYWGYSKSKTTQVRKQTEQQKRFRRTMGYYRLKKAVSKLGPFNDASGNGRFLSVRK